MTLTALGGEVMKKNSWLIVAFALIAGGVVGACSGSSGPKTVNITATDFKYEASQTTFKVGVPYHFVIKNEGSVPHELMIMKPMTEEAGMDMEEMDKLALANVESDELEPGQTATLDYTFMEPAAMGELEFACHIKGHYDQGMHLPIEVQ
jgi:uncharacterized cupredoxin-like copper-binding protein